MSKPTYVSGAAFVRTVAKDVKASKVVELGKEQGLKFGTNLVYAVRSGDKKKGQKTDNTEAAPRTRRAAKKKATSKPRQQKIHASIPLGISSDPEVSALVDKIVSELTAIAKRRAIRMIEELL